MTNYFRVSRGVRQGCYHPIHKKYIKTQITGIELPYSCEAKLSQFADDTTLICKDTLFLYERMSVLVKFGDI